MHHRIEDYTDGDLAVAIQSPYNPTQRQFDLEAEIYRRKFNLTKDCWEYQNYIRTKRFWESES